MQTIIYDDIIEDEFIPRTLTNSDNKYINSILQFMGGIDDFIDYFINNTKKYVDYIENNKKPLLSFVTSRLYYNLFKKEETIAYNTNNFLITLKQFDKCIAKEETNPNYILKFIIEQLHNEVKDKINEENSTIIVHDKSNMMQVIDKEIDSFKKKNNSIISDTLNICLIKTYNCNKCNKRFYETKNYSTFQLNINEIARLKKNNSKKKDTKSISLLDCLGINKNNINLFCENCNSYELFNTSQKFYELGKKIIFLLDKNESNIPFKIEQTIDLKDYAFNPQKNFKYDLRGIISYDNNKKIFVAFIKSHINKKWYLYMDEIVEEKNDINEVLNDNNNKYVHYSLMYAQAVGA